MAVRSPGAVRRLPGEPTAENAANGIGHITLGVKRAGKRGAGKPPAPFDVAGVGDVTMGAGLRPTAKGVDEPPDPTVRARSPRPYLRGGGDGDVTSLPDAWVGNRPGLPRDTTSILCRNPGGFELFSPYSTQEARNYACFRVTVQSPIRHRVCKKGPDNRRRPCNSWPPQYRRHT